MSVHELLLTIFIAAIIAALLWVRSAFVSLNKDMREILFREAEIRQRLEALEGGPIKPPPPMGYHREKR
jgi:hypothetical protein